MGNSTVQWFVFAAAPFEEQFRSAEGDPEQVLERCRAACGKGEHTTSDVIHDMHDGLAWDIEDALDDDDSSLSKAWTKLWAALGKDAPQGDLPDWVREQWDPEGWHVGLVDPAQAVKLQSKLDETELRTRAAALLKKRSERAAKDWAKLLELLDRAAGDDGWLLAVESLS